MRRIIILLLLLSSSGLALAAGDATAGKNKVILCIGCHGSDGNGSSSLFPKLAGQGEAYLAKQLRDFKTGARREEHMTAMVENIMLADIDDIAAYFSGQVLKADTRGQNDTIGKEIYHRGINSKGITACANCHGMQGLGVTNLNYPSLAGQYRDYLVKQLKEFRSGARQNDRQQVMQDIASKLTDEEINSVTNYINSLH